MGWLQCCGAVSCMSQLISFRSGNKVSFSFKKDSQFNLVFDGWKHIIEASPSVTADRTHVEDQNIILTNGSFGL